MMEVYYRYEDDRNEGTLNAFLWSFRVIKHTQHGVWLDVSWKDKPRFVLNSGRKRFAFPTKEEAAHSYLKRKKHQHSIYYHRCAALEDLFAHFDQRIQSATHSGPR